MNKIIEYKTAAAERFGELDKKIAEMIGHGFQPYGSPYLSDYPVEGMTSTFVVAQAMVKYEEASCLNPEGLFPTPEDMVKLAPAT
jgi:hypothetical protein